MNMRIQQPYFQLPPVQERANKAPKPTTSFKDTFQAELQAKTNLHISKHAETRLQDRGITIAEATWSKIEHALERARVKGVRDAVVVTNEATLVVSAENNSVITALDRAAAEEHIFTNINGTIIIDNHSAGP